VKLYSVFLRKGCILADYLNPLREPIGDDWTPLEQIAATVFESIIHKAGWHFIWIRGACSRKGFGITQEDAIHRALVRAPRGGKRQFNAAVLNSVQVAMYPGFHIANVTLQPRNIQRHTSLETADSR
jgi:hypothetical protein